MKNHAFIFIFFLYTGCVYCQFPSGMPTPSIPPFVKECVASADMNEGFSDPASVLSNPKFPCLLKCVFDRMGFMNGAMIAVDKVLQFAAKYIPDEEKKTTIENCLNEANQKSESGKECESAYRGFMCFFQAFKNNPMEMMSMVEKFQQ